MPYNHKTGYGSCERCGRTVSRNAQRREKNAPWTTNGSDVVCYECFQDQEGDNNGDR